MKFHRTPDKWVILKIRDKMGKTFYKVFGSWYGGYLSGDSWRLSSDIIRVKDMEGHYLVYNSSGSIYKCNKNEDGVSGYSAGILETIKNRSKKIGLRIKVVDIDKLPMLKR